MNVSLAGDPCGLVSCYAFLRRQEDTAERERDKVEFTQKAVSDSYIGHDCLIAVSMVMLLMVGEQ